MPKEQHHNHEIDKRAVAQLNLKIIDCGWIFRNQPESDYGIDAELERCIAAPDGKKYVLGELFKTQVKGTEKLETVDDGSTVVFDIEKDDLAYLIGLTATPLLIVVDVTAQKAYWFDIKAQGEGLLKEKPENKWYRLKTPIDHEITPQNAVRFYEHLHQAEYLTFRQGLVRHLTDKEIASALLDVSSLHDTVAPRGHRVFSRDPNTYRAPGTVMSITEGENAVDVVQADSFKPGDEIKVKMQLEFPNDEEGRKARDEWEQHMKGGTATVELGGKYVKNVRVLAGEKTIADMPSANLYLGASRRKMKLVLRSRKTGEQLCVTGESWNDPGKLCFDSSAFDASQTAHLSLDIEMESGHASIRMSLNPLCIPTCRDAEYVISILNSFGEGIELLLEERGIARKIAETETAPLELNEEGTDLVRRLAVIEEKANVVFPFRKFQEISRQEVDNVILLSSLLSDESVTKPMTLSMTPSEDKGLVPDGQYVRIESPEEMQFSILGQQIPWSEGVIAEGRCERSTRVPDGDRMSVQMYVPRCRIRSSKNGKAISPTDEP